MVIVVVVGVSGARSRRSVFVRQPFGLSCRVVSRSVFSGIAPGHVLVPSLSFNQLLVLQAAFRGFIKSDSENIFGRGGRSMVAAILLGMTALELARSSGSLSD